MMYLGPFQHDSAPSYSSRMTECWIQAHIPPFISKVWFEPIHLFSVVHLESQICSSHHASLDDLKAKLCEE